MEDYLRTIYNIYESQGEESYGIRSVDIASALKISKPSVSAMIKKLTEKGYLKSKPYSDIFFTPKGLKEAKRITQKHRIIEVFLKKTLKYNVDLIHKEAHMLEHAFSEESIKRLDNFLNNPKTCPHGKKIGGL